MEIYSKFPGKFNLETYKVHDIGYTKKITD